jgi:hypothetical protein
MKCFFSMTGGTILGLLTGIGIIDLAAAHGINAALCCTIGFLGGGMSGLPQCLD